MRYPRNSALIGIPRWAIRRADSSATGGATTSVLSMPVRTIRSASRTFSVTPPTISSTSAWSVASSGISTRS